MELMIDKVYLKELRNKRSWTQEHVAEVSGISLRTIQRIEKEGVCSLDSRQALASVFEISADQLQVGDVEKARNRRYRRVLIVAYIGNTLGALSSFAATTYSLLQGKITGGEAGLYYGGVALFCGFFYVFLALMVDYFRKHRVGEWQINI